MKAHPVEGARPGRGDGRGDDRRGLPQPASVHRLLLGGRPSNCCPTASEPSASCRRTQATAVTTTGSPGVGAGRHRTSRATSSKGARSRTRGSVRIEDYAHRPANDGTPENTTPCSGGSGSFPSVHHVTLVNTAQPRGRPAARHRPRRGPLVRALTVRPGSRLGASTTSPSRQSGRTTSCSNAAGRDLRDRRRDRRPAADGRPPRGRTGWWWPRSGARAGHVNTSRAGEHRRQGVGAGRTDRREVGLVASPCARHRRRPGGVARHARGPSAGLRDPRSTAGRAKPDLVGALGATYHPAPSTGGPVAGRRDRVHRRRLARPGDRTPRPDRRRLLAGIPAHARSSSTPAP